RYTARHCARCAPPACADCRHQAAVGSQCWECIKAARPPTRERVRRSIAARPLIAPQTLIIANVAMFVYTNGLNDGLRGNQRLARYVVFAPAVDQGEWWRLITS